MDEKVFLTGREEFDLSRKLVKEIFESGFFPNVVIGIWKGGTPAAITIHDSFTALARFHGFPEPRYHNAVKAESDGHVEIKNLDPLLEEIRDNDHVLVVGNVFRDGTTLDMIIHGIRNSGRAGLDVRDAVQVYRPLERGVRKPRYHAMEEEAHVVFPWQMSIQDKCLSNKEIEQHRPEIAGFLLRDEEIVIPSIAPGKVEQRKLFVTDEIYRLARQLAVKAYLDGVKPTYILGVWRGGTPIAIAVYDMVNMIARKKGFSPPGFHNVVRAGSYGPVIGEAGDVKVRHLDRVLADVSPDDIVLKIDDVHERGTTDETIKAAFRERGIPIFGYDLFAKPLNNQTGKKQDGVLYTLNNVWIAFPHETAEWTFEKKGDAYVFREETRPLLGNYRPHLAGLFRK